MMFQASSGGLLPQDKEEQAAAQRWLEAMPAVSVSIVRRAQDARADFALMMPAQRARAFGLAQEGGAVHGVKGGMALHAVTHCGEEQYDNPETIFGPLEAFAREHRFAQKGAMWGCVLFVDCSGGRRKHFYDTYMIIG